MNAINEHRHITETLKEIINIESIRKIYAALRDVIWKYLFIEYQS